MRTRTALSSLLVSAVVLLGACSFFGSFANEHWVSPDGSDGAVGDEASPWQTIGAALNRAAPGDTIHVLPGVYYERVIVEKSGEDGAPIRIIGYEGAVMDGSQEDSEEEGYWGGLLEFQGVSHVEVRGLTIRNTKGSGMFFRDGSSDVVVAENTTLETSVSGIGIWEASNVTVTQNTVESAALLGEGAGIQLVDVTGFEVSGNTIADVGTAEFNEDGISVARASSDGVVHGNVVSGVVDRAIVVESWEGSTITDIEVTGNTISDSGSGVELHPSAGGTVMQATVTGNTVESCESAYLVNNFLESGTPGTASAITLDANRATSCETAFVLQVMPGSVFESITITNNVADTMTDYGCVLMLIDASAAPLLTDVLVVNNTFYNTNGDGGPGAGLDISSYLQATSSVVVANNIFAGNNERSLVIELDNPATVEVDHNLFTEAVFGETGETHGTNAVESGATIFTDAGAGDFTLATGSPARDAGRTADAPASDIAGITRPQGTGVDMGAYEAP